jgi:hypothetical protein
MMRFSVFVFKIRTYKLRHSPTFNQIFTATHTLTTTLHSPSDRLNLCRTRTDALKMSARCLYDFVAENPKELTLRGETLLAHARTASLAHRDRTEALTKQLHTRRTAGDMVRLHSQANAEWWQGECNGRTGLFPATYVQVLQQPGTSTLSPTTEPTHAVTR